MGYNNDWAPNNYTYLQVVPGDATHYQYVRILTLGSVPRGRHQRQAARGQLRDGHRRWTAPSSAADPFVKKGYGGEIWDLILQQCSTAQEALALLGQMAQTGFTAGAAGSFGIADPEEAWTFELLGGHHWVAQRVPDNAVLAHPNIVVVRQVDLSDTANFRGSSDLQSFAQSIGRYIPSEGPFDVAWAYHDRDVLQSYYNTDRLWGAFDLVAPSLGLTPDMPYATRPVFVVPDHKVNRQDIAAICRYHYEGTSIDQTAGYSLMSPHDQTNRPICYSTTCHSEVWQLRSWKPDDIGGVMWVALSRPCSSTYVPFYGSVTSVPAAWSGRTAFNEFRDVAESLDRNGTINGLTRYGYYIPLVRSTYGAFETDVRERAGEHRGDGRRAERPGAHHVPDQLLGQRAAQALNLAIGLPAQMP